MEHWIVQDADINCVTDLYILCFDSWACAIFKKLIFNDETMGACKHVGAWHCVYDIRKSSLFVNCGTRSPITRLICTQQNKKKNTVNRLKNRKWIIVTHIKYYYLILKKFYIVIIQLYKFRASCSLNFIHTYQFFLSFKRIDWDLFVIVKNFHLPCVLHTHS